MPMKRCSLHWSIDMVVNSYWFQISFITETTRDCITLNPVTQVCLNQWARKLPIDK